MAGFRAAVSVGSHALETDLHLSSDGVVVLSHVIIPLSSTFHLTMDSYLTRWLMEDDEGGMIGPYAETMLRRGRQDQGLQLGVSVYTGDDKGAEAKDAPVT